MTTVETHANQRSLTLLCWSAVLAFFSYSMARSPILPLYGQTLGLGAAAIGWIVAASTITGIFCKLPAGALSDVYGRRRMLLCSGLVFAGMPFLYPLAASEQSLILLRVLHGLATAIFGPVAGAAVADLFQERRAEAMGWYTSSRTGGNLLGPFVAGALISVVGFHLAFTASGLAGLAALGAITLFGRRFPASGTLAEAPQMAANSRRALREMAKGLREVLRNKYILTTSGMEAVEYFALGTVEAFLPLYAVSIGYPAWQIGVLFGVQAGVALLARPLVGRVADRVGRRPVIFAGVVTGGCFLMLVPFVEAFSLLLAVVMLFGLAEAVATSATAALAADFARPEAYGLALGVFGTIMDVGHAAGPVVAGLLVAAFAFRVTFAVVGLLLIVAGFYFIALVPEPRDLRVAVE